MGDAIVAVNVEVETELKFFLASEVKKLRTDGLAMIFHHQGAKKLMSADVYQEFDKKDSGKVAESAFVKFFATCEKKEVDGVKAEGLSEDDSEISRIKVKAMSDDLEGWVTPVGNQGTIFLEDGGNVFKVVKDTILTGTFVIGGESKQKDRKLKVGEKCEVREWAKKEETTGLVRMKVLVQSDGQIGYVTSVGNTGIKFLEVI